MEDHGKITDFVKKDAKTIEFPIDLAPKGEKISSLTRFTIPGGKAGKTRITDEGALKEGKSGGCVVRFDEVLKLGQVYVILRLTK